MPKVVLLGLTHALALFFGWLAAGERLADGLRTADEMESPPAVRPRPVAHAEGLRLLEEMRAGWQTAEAHAKRQTALQTPTVDVTADRNRATRRQHQEELEEIQRRSLEVALTADPEAELARLADGPEIRDSAAFAIAWLRADPAAALAFLEGSEVLSRNSNMARALELWTADAGADPVLALLDLAPSWQEKLIAAVLRNTVSEDPEQLGDLLGRLERLRPRSEIIDLAFASVPETRQEPVFRWILASLEGAEAGRAVLRLAIGMPDPAVAARFLLTATRTLDPEAVRTMKEWGNYQDVILRGSGPNASFESRVEAMLALGAPGPSEEERRSAAMIAVVQRDGYEWYRNSDLRDAMRFGRMNAADLWHEVSGAFDAQVPTEAVLEIMAGDAIRHDPAGAIALIERLGHAEQTGKFLLRALDDGFSSDLERTLAAIAAVPEDVWRRDLARLDQFYESRIPYVAEQAGGFWIDWLIEQPPGLSRDLMLHQTALHCIKTGRTAPVERLRAGVQDATVRALPGFARKP